MATHRIAIIGSTGRGDYGHATDTAWFGVPNTEIVAVADDNSQGLARAAKRLRVNKAFADYRRMLDEVKPSIVTICPRWIDQHHDMAIAAAERGIHIFMEKPFCRDLEEADRIVAACEKTHTLLSLGHPTRFSPKLVTVKRLIAEGAIGKVLEYRGRGKEDSRGGGEDLWVLGTHVMDMIRALGGAPLSCFGYVTQDNKPITKASVYDGEEGIGPLAGDAIRASYTMKDGSIAYFNSYRNTAGKPRRYGLTIYGSQGVIELLEGALPVVKYLGDSSWSPGRSGSSWQDVSSAGIGKPEPLTDKKYSARYRLGFEDLLDAIEKNRQPLGSVYESRGVVEMTAAVFESHRVGAAVDLPLKTRTNPLKLLS